MFRTLTDMLLKGERKRRKKKSCTRALISKLAREYSICRIIFVVIAANRIYFFSNDISGRNPSQVRFYVFKGRRPEKKMMKKELSFGLEGLINVLFGSFFFFFFKCVYTFGRIWSNREFGHVMQTRTLKD